MKTTLIRMVLLTVMLYASVMPAGAAAVTKTTSETTFAATVDTEISPNTEVTCTKQFTDSMTIWWKESAYWKQDIDETVIGTCEEGTTFQCNSKITMNAQNFGTFSSTGNCWFSYPDGSKLKNTFHWTYANGECRVEFSKWN